MRSHEPSYNSVLDIIHRWPAQQRFLLVQDVLKTLQPQDQPPRTEDTLQIARGLLATNRPAPTDEEIRRWLEEHRLEKYG